jgi:hypothetical protein
MERHVTANLTMFVWMECASLLDVMVTLAAPPNWTDVSAVVEMGQHAVPLEASSRPMSLA